MESYGKNDGIFDGPITIGGNVDLKIVISTAVNGDNHLTITQIGAIIKSHHHYSTYTQDI